MYFSGEIAFSNTSFLFSGEASEMNRNGMKQTGAVRNVQKHTKTDSNGQKIRETDKHRQKQTVNGQERTVSLEKKPRLARCSRNRFGEKRTKNREKCTKTDVS